MSLYLFMNILCIFTFSRQINGYRILFVAMPEAGSHRGSMYPFAKALENHGHDVTIFSEALIDHKENEGPVKEKLVKLKNIEPHLLGQVHQNTSDFIKIVWEWDSNILAFFIPWKNGADCCKNLLKYQLDEFWQVANDSWDLILVDEVFTPCGIAIASLNPAPNIIFNPSLFDNPSAESKGIPGVPHITPPCFAVPAHRWSETNFFDRVASIKESWIWQLLNKFAIHWIINSTIGHLVPDFSFPSYISNSAAVVTDYPETVDWPRPRGLDSIYIGCNCKIAGKPLPEDLELFVNDPDSKGTILVAFGTMGNWAIAPKHISKKFFKALAQMTDYRIIFQFKGDPSIFPPHIKAMKWLPQTDILLHPKTKLFISHGGLKSLKETVCAEVPVLYLPLFAEQLRNALAAEVFGFGERLNKHTFQPETVVRKMNQILESSQYKTNIQMVKERWLDHPIPQLEEGVFWAEYIIRRHGMPSVFHRRSKDLYWFQHWCLDIAFVCAACLVALLFAVMTILRKIWIVVCR